MTHTIIGREREIKQLEDIVASNRAELVATYRLRGSMVVRRNDGIYRGLTMASIVYVHVSII